MYMGVESECIDEGGIRMSQYNTISGNKSLIKAKKNKEYFERILNFYRCKKGNGSLMVHSLFIHGIVKKI